jgi:hypothetical protein
MFINEPYVTCPKCGKDAFGVLSIYARRYSRRCAECRYDESFGLPPVSRKVIYLDQFAISEMMKSINESLKKTDKVNPFFRKLFEKLDALNKMQVIICPESTNHFDESFVSPYYQSLKRLYQQLAHNFDFYDPETIKRFQVLEDFNGWIGIQKRPIDIGDVLTGTGDLDGWEDRFIISVSLRDQDPDLADELRKDRDQISDALVQIFNEWQTEKDKTFKDWYEEERSSYGKDLIQSYLKGLIRYDQLATGKIPYTLENMGSITSNTSVIMTVIHQKLREKGFTDEEGMKKSFEYLNSESLKKIPYVQISAILFASLAREASLGRKKPPTKGMMNDIEVISCYAPYCDAIFVDNECRRLLNQGIKETGYKLKTKVFSQDNKDEFLLYLDEIEKSVNKKHLEKVKEVYGDKWLTPYVEMFSIEKK